MLKNCRNHSIWNKKKAKSTFCPLPWNHLLVTTKGFLRLCCSSDHPHIFLTHKNGKEIHFNELTDKSLLDNNPFLNRIRRQMLLGQKPPECKQCYEIESAEVESPRMHFSGQFPLTLDEALRTTHADGSTIHKIQYVDLRISTLCNLRCRMCSHHTSRKLIPEALVLNLISQKEYKETLKQESWFQNKKVWDFLLNVIDQIEVINFAGGEPMLINEHISLLEKFIEKGFSKKIILKCTTNTTYIPEILFDYWTQFKEVRINCSVDGTQKVNEYIRNPTNWSIIHKNLKKIEEYMHEHRNMYVRINTTVQIYNITHLIPLFEYVKQFKRIRKFPYLNILIAPAHFCIKVLPAHIKIEIADELSKWLDDNKKFYIDNFHHEPNHDIWSIKTLINDLISGESLNQYEKDFKFYTEFYDKYRNEKFTLINPKLKSWYENISLD